MQPRLSNKTVINRFRAGVTFSLLLALSIQVVGLSEGQGQDRVPQALTAPIRQPQAIKAGNSSRNDSVVAASYESIRTEPSPAASSSSSAPRTESKKAGAKYREPLPLRPKNDKNLGEIEAPKKGWNGLVSMIASLSVVIGVFLVLTYLFRKSTHTQKGVALPKEVVQVLGRCTLAPRQQLYLLRFGHRLVLVTHQLGQTETISEIDDPIEVDRIAGLCEQSAKGSVTESFRQVLEQVSMGQSLSQKRGALVR